MPVGLRINVDGSFDLFDYRPEEIKDQLLELRTINKGRNWEVVEKIFLEDRIFLGYGYLDGEEFNKFEFNYCNPYGDVIVICVSNEYNFMDVDIDEFNKVFVSEDITGEEEDEDGYNPNGESYDYGDHFCVRDEELDYEEHFSDDDLY